MRTFIPISKTTLRYTTPIYGENLELVANEFFDHLEDFPEPVFKWLDERSDDCLHGPGCWTCEIQEDQLTVFEFYVAHLEEDEIGPLMLLLEETILEDRQGLTFGSEAFFNLTFKREVLFVARSEKPEKLRYHVYWEVAD